MCLAIFFQNVQFLQYTCVRRQSQKHEVHLNFAMPIGSHELKMPIKDLVFLKNKAIWIKHLFSNLKI